MRSPSRLPGLNVPASPTPPGPWPPPPPRGAGAVVVIPEENRIRERKPTPQLVLQVLPIPWTVGGILPWWLGRRGGGFYSLLCLSAFNMTVKGARRSKHP